MGIQEMWREGDSVLIIGELRDNIGEMFDRITHLITNNDSLASAKVLQKQMRKRGADTELLILRECDTDTAFTSTDLGILFFDEIESEETVTGIIENLREKECPVCICILCWENLLDVNSLNGRKIISI